MKYQHFLISICLLGSFLWSNNIFANSINDYDSQSLLSHFEQSLADKNFTDITSILRQDLSRLKSFPLNQETLPIIKFDSVEQADESDESDEFIIIDRNQIQQMVKQLVKNLSFSQSIEDENSIIQLAGLSDDIRDQLTTYKRYNFTPPLIALNKVTFYDGTFLELNDNALDMYRARLQYSVESTKRITIIDILVNYMVPDKPLETLTFTASKLSTKQGDINLLFVDNNVAEFEFVNRDPDSILHVEAIDKQNHIVNSSNQWSYQFNQPEIDIIINFYQILLNQIDQNVITDKTQLLRYLEDHIQVLSDNLQQVYGQLTTRVAYYFKRQPMTITLFVKPDPQIMAYQAQINTSKSPYYNHAIVSSFGDNNVKGLKAETGEIIVDGNYRDIDYLVDQYYRVSLINDGWNYKIYRLDTANQQFAPQPFYMMDSKLYLQRWIIVNQDANNNFIKGLVDIQNHQLAIPLQYSNINISESFIIASRINKAKQIDDNEVYNSNNLQKLFSGQGRVTVDKNNFIVKNEICVTQEPNYYKYSTTSRDNITYYCYDNYHLYDDKGQQLSTAPYFDVSDNFSQNNLLLVTTDKQQQRFVNRQGQDVEIALDSYINVSPFSEGLAVVECSSNQLYGYINTQGKLTIPCLYQSASQFIGGSALVEQNDQYQLISPTNSVIKRFDTSLAASERNGPDSITYFFHDGSTYNNKGEHID
ncbi:WG repeat protein [Orbus hercynius]|uniref:WG repeat protein n=1 Tax=Orbus hercynius TaxID=593135 RepID=A0A495RI87_9GAMM|nr:WG repeat-containing protein [Orbus hercynius]RKS86984.1 WG repeat protein [Orbus hercynius]